MSISTLQSLQDSANRAEELRTKRIAMGYTIMEFFGGHKLTLILWNGRDDQKQSQLRLPLPKGIAPIWIDPNTTIDHCAKCAGLTSYDCAIPIGWVREHYTSKGLEFPKGVWSYDENRVMGEFYPLDRMLQTIALELVRMGFDAINLPTIAHSPQPPPPMVAGDIISALWGVLGRVRAIYLSSNPDSTINARLEFGLSPARLMGVAGEWVLVEKDIEPSPSVGATIKVDWFNNLPPQSAIVTEIREDGAIYAYRMSGDGDQVSSSDRVYPTKSGVYSLDAPSPTQFSGYPPIPYGVKEFQCNYGYAIPVSVHKWEWSITFGRWGAVVEWEGGKRVYTFPKLWNLPPGAEWEDIK